MNLSAHFSSLLRLAALAILMGGLTGCTGEDKPSPAMKMSDEELAAETGVGNDAIAIVRAVGGTDLRPLTNPNGDTPAGLQFAAPARSGETPLRAALNPSLEPHQCRVYIIEAKLAAGPVAGATSVYALLPTMDPFELLRVMQTTLTSPGDTERLIEQMESLHGRAPLDIAGAGRNFINVQFRGPVYPVWEDLAKELFEQYPKATKPWWETPSDLAAEMQACLCMDLAIE